jgi:hypothetical protein
VAALSLGQCLNLALGKFLSHLKPFLEGDLGIKAKGETANAKLPSKNSLTRRWLPWLVRRAVISAIL